MNSVIHRYYTHLATSCITGCVRNYVLTSNPAFLESDLICCESMLNLKYDSEEGGLRSQVKEMIEAVGKHTGLRLVSYAPSTDQQKNIGIHLASRDMVMLHIDSKCLSYTETFGKTITSHSNHYVNVLHEKLDRYLISDSYIPSIPPSTYEGYLEVNKEFLDKATIYIVTNCNIAQFSPKFRTLNVLKSAENYLLAKNSGIDIYEKFVLDIISIQMKGGDKEVHRKLLEMAANVIIGGLYASRVLFSECIVHSDIEVKKKEQAVRQFDILTNAIMQLKLLLAKCSFSNREKDYQAVIQKITFLRLQELDILQTILQ